MKKILIACLIFLSLSVFGNEKESIVLQLSKNDDLVIDDGRLEIRNTTINYLSLGGSFDAIPKLIDRLPNGQPVWAFVTGIFSAGKVTSNEQNNMMLVNRVEKTSFTEKEGKAFLKAKAFYPDGTSEEWEITIDKERETFNWQRKQSDNNHELSFIAQLPRSETNLQYFQTGKAACIINDAVKGVTEGHTDTLSVQDESELIYYAVNPDNSFRTMLSNPGNIQISKKVIAHKPDHGIPPWALDKDGNQVDQQWDIVWNTASKTDAGLSCSWGITAATRDFVGRKHIEPVNASYDFGPFFSQMFLACVPLNLRNFNGRLGLRCNVLIGDIEVYKDIFVRDNVWAYEFTHVVDPQAITGLIEQYFDLHPKGQFMGPDYVQKYQTRTFYGEDSQAELLILAGRHLMLTNNKEFVRQHIDEYHKCAEFLLNLRRPGEDLPICQHSWDGQGMPLSSKEPYFVALCYMAFNRLADMDEAIDNAELATKWRQEAKKMKDAALKNYADGGLWDPDRGTFIKFIDYRDPENWGYKMQDWYNPGKVQKNGIPRTDFVFYETIIPIYLGLLDDPDKIKKAYEWIDANFNYSYGRGGVTMPEGWAQDFVILFDVMNRKNYDIPRAENVLQLLLSQGMNIGMPLTETSIYNNTKWRVHAGRPWDNSPYFHLVINMHYGLDYTWEGWKISDPNPLKNYTLTRISNLSHKDARYSITWNGTGKVKSIKVDGNIWPTKVINLTNGEHNVEVFLQ
jgi:hypothetical protein